MEIKNAKIEDLIPYANNARQHSDEQVAQIAASIREFGFNNPVLCDGANGVIAGHGRILAARKLGLKTVPIIELSHLSDVQKKAYILADNRIAENATWDEALVQLELDALQSEGFDTLLTGFDLQSDEVSPLDADEVPPVEDVAVTQAGDVWILGPHRLACGDATVLSDIDRAMGGVMADACWTDPPYNVDYESKAGKIKNDKMASDAFLAFLGDAFVSAFAVLKPGSPVYVAHADIEGLSFRLAFKSAGFKLSGCLIWAKNSLVMGRSDYQWQHEPILYGWKPGAAHRWYGGRKQTTLVGGNACSEFAVNEDGTVTVTGGSEVLILSGENLKATPVCSSLFRVKKPRVSADHPTMKPVELIVSMLKNSTRKGDIVLDLFAGSGSTLVACEALGRIARLVELDPMFCDVIVKRWEFFTGKAAVLEATGRPFSEVAGGGA